MAKPVEINELLAELIESKADLEELCNGISDGTWRDAYRELQILNKQVRLLQELAVACSL